MSMSEMHAGEAHLHVSHQFEDEEQQFNSYSLGMWVFLVQELLFFGGLFTAFFIYRHMNFDAFVVAHKKLDITWGAVNTVVLLASSLSMALGVRAATLDRWKAAVGWITITTLLACVFLGVKYIEYSAKFEHHLFPGANFSFAEPGVDEGGAHMFFVLYFTMTGLHGLHVLVGIFIMLWIIGRIIRFRKQRCDYIPVELSGLYWHFVDLVWIFLFPLLYLIG